MAAKQQNSLLIYHETTKFWKIHSINYFYSKRVYHLCP